MMKTGGGNISCHQLAFCVAAGFTQLEREPYYNSGVMFVRDTPKAQQLFESWHSLWLQSLQRGVARDQPALSQTNVNQNYPIQLIPNVWNCQILHRQSVAYLQQAKVMHYFTKGDQLRTILLQHFRENDHHIDRIVDGIISNPRQIGYFFFFFNEDRLHRLSSSTLIYDTEENPPFFRAALPLSRFLLRPVQWLSKMKHWLDAKS